MIRIFFLLLFFLIGTSVQHLANASFCSKDAPVEPCPGGAAVPYDKQFHCDKAVDPNLGLGNVTIGWGENCAVYSGGTSVSDKSCLATGSIVGQVFDTISTVGVGILMRKNFCSFSPGDPTLEGAFIHRKIFFDNCASYGPEEKDECVGCIFQGQTFTSGKCDMSRSPLNDDSSLSNYSYVDTKGDRNIELLCNEGVPNLDKPLLDSSGRQVFTNNIPVFCPLTRCNIPTNDIKVKYYDDINYRLAVVWPFLFVAGGYLQFLDPSGLSTAIFMTLLMAPGDCSDINALKGGDSSNVGIWGIIKLRGVVEADQICAQMLFGFTGWTTLACKPRVAPQIIFPKTPCFIEGTSCAQGGSHSKWFLPITSKVMECTTDVFNTLFKEARCTNGLLTFQQNMQGIVKLLLILYIIIFGIQIAFGKSISKREFFVFVLKFALVIFFAVGSLHKSGVSGDANKNGLLLLRELVNSGMISFSEMVMSASSKMIGGKGDAFCNFSNMQYGREGEYNYLRIWDALDCRLSFYLGLASPTNEGLKMVDGGGGAMKIGSGILSMIWGLIFSWKLPIIIFLFLFTIFLLSMIVHLVHLYILAMVAISILIFFGPIFIPLALFDETKDFCEKWVKLLIGYSLQPVIVLAIISFMLITFDKILFTDCSFASKSVMGMMPYWVMDETYPNPTPTCQRSLGYMVQFFSSKNLQRVSADTEEGVGGEPLFYYNTVTSDFVSMLEAFMFGTFFAFLFYFFAQQMSTIAAELSDSAGLGKFAAGATAVWDAAATAVSRGTFSKGKAAPKAGAGTDSGSKASRGGVDSGSRATASSGIGVAASAPISTK